jgi:hypothetical protein
MKAFGPLMVLCFVALCGGLGVGSASASPALVMLTSPDQPKVTRTLQEAVRAQLSDVDVRLRIQAVKSLATGRDCRLASAHDFARAKGVAAVFWFDSADNRVCLLFSPGRGGRLVNRRVTGSGEEGRFEAVAVLLRTALRETPAPRRVVNPAPKGARGLFSPRSLRRPGQARLELELTYALELVSVTAAPSAHGLRLGVQVGLHRHWSVFLGYRLEVRMALDGDAGAVELQRYPVDAGVRFRWWFGALELGARLGLGFAYTQLFERLPSSSSNAAKMTAKWLVFAGAYGYVGVRLIPRTLLFVAVGARCYLLNAQYQSDTDEVLLSPWIVQPSLLVGLGVDLF